MHHGDVTPVKLKCNPNNISVNIVFANVMDVKLANYTSFGKNTIGESCNYHT